MGRRKSSELSNSPSFQRSEAQRSCSFPARNNRDGTGVMQAKCHRFVFSQLKNGKCFVIIAQRPQASTLELLRAKTQNSQGCLWPFSGSGCFWHPVDLVLPEPEHISRVPVKKDKVNASFNGLLGQTFPFFVTSCNLVPSFYVWNQFQPSLYEPILKLLNAVRIEQVGFDLGHARRT